MQLNLVQQVAEKYRKHLCWKSSLLHSKGMMITDAIWILYNHQNRTFIVNNLNHDFNNLCEWFICNKLCIHFGENKTKSNLLKREKKSNLSLNITQNEKAMKQHSVVKYLGRSLDQNISAKTMAWMVFKKFKGKKKILYRQSRYLLYPLKRILCNILIQPRFGFACYSILVSKFVSVIEN